jgi:hypothetical protein
MADGCRTTAPAGRSFHRKTGPQDQAKTERESKSILFFHQPDDGVAPGSAHHHKTLDVAPTDRYLIAAEHGPQIEAEWR